MRGSLYDIQKDSNPTWRTVVSDIRRNLVSASTLIQKGFKIVLELTKIVITKNSVFIGNGFVYEGLFKLNVVTYVLNEITANSFCSVFATGDI